MPKFKLSPVQKAFRDSISDLGKETFENVFEELAKAKTVGDFIEQLGDDYDIDPALEPVDVFDALLEQISWEELSKDEDYEKFKAEFSKAKTDKSHKQVKKEKKKPKGRTVKTSEARELVIKTAVGILKKNKKPMIVKDLKEKIEEATKLSGSLVYRTITEYGQGKFETDGDFPSLVPTTEGNKRAYELG